MPYMIKNWGSILARHTPHVVHGGGRGIRTPDPVERDTRFRVVRFRPLSHPSISIVAP